MMIEKFYKLFSELGELCFKIKMVERPARPYDFKNRENEVVNSYYNEVMDKYPKTIMGFYMAIGRNDSSISCYLQDNGEVVVDFYDMDHNFEKSILFKSIRNVSDNKIGIIHFLTRESKFF